MKCVEAFGFPARAALLLGILAGSAGDVRADGINFLALPEEQVSSLDVGGVTITGSNTLVINDAPGATGHGIGVLGGAPGFPYGDGTIDSTESVTFKFDSGPVTNIVLSPQLLGTFGSGPGYPEGSSVITAFGPSGQSIGAVVLLPSTDSLREFNISTAFSNQPISSFTFQPEGTAVGGTFASLAELTFTPVPEPTSVLAWGFCAMIAVGVVLRRRRQRGCCEAATRKVI
jgi:hypothetical protein